MKRLSIGIFGFLLVVLTFGSPHSSQAHAPLQTVMTPDPLRQPPTVYPPTQAGDGAQVYWQVCMICHGDQGQGLTPEYRASLGPEDNNCWQTGCHGGRIPSGGFVLPKQAPAVWGGVLVDKFNTALNLYQFLKAKMPWQKPGYLKDTEYWDLTAFLLEKNGVDYGEVVLNEQTAAGIKLQPDQSTPLSFATWNGFREDAFWIGLGVGVLILFVGGILLKFRRR